MQVEEENTELAQKLKKIRSSVQTTLFYGFGSVPVDEKYQDNTKEYNMIQSIPEEEILNYKIDKIECKSISETKTISSIKITYKNINTGKEVVLTDTPTNEKNGLNQEFKLNDLEEIIKVRVWVDQRLIGFEVLTNKDRKQKFGFGEDDKLIKIDELETNDKIVVGFGVYASEVIGVTGMFCYYMDKKQNSIFLNSGLFYLRIKNKKKGDMGASKKDDEKMYTLNEVTKLPDNLFFEIAKYAVGK